MIIIILLIFGCEGTQNELLLQTHNACAIVTNQLMSESKEQLLVEVMKRQDNDLFLKKVYVQYFEYCLNHIKYQQIEQILKEKTMEITIFKDVDFIKSTMKYDLSEKEEKLLQYVEEFSKNVIENTPLPEKERHLHIRKIAYVIVPIWVLFLIFFFIYLKRKEQLKQKVKGN